MIGAHRAAWELANGPIPPGAYLCHSCHTPSCTNVVHLRLCTHQDNVDDAVALGRHPHGESSDRSVYHIWERKRWAGSCRDLAA